jgi:hypothetical protein
VQHNHPLQGSFSDGTFTVTVGAANFNSTTPTSYTYNVAESEWFKSKVNAA